MNPCINIFGQPVPTPDDVSAVAGLLEWSADGATYQPGPAPAGTQVYLRVTAPADVDVSGTAFLAVTLSKLPATVLGQVVSTLGTESFIGGDYGISVLAADEVTVLFDAGELAFL